MPPIRILVALLLSIPVALVTYMLTSQALAGMDMPDGIGGILIIFLPLLVAGVCSIPFLAPFVDYKAKQALANAPSAKKDEPTDGPDAA